MFQEFDDIERPVPREGRLLLVRRLAVDARLPDRGAVPVRVPGGGRRPRGLRNTAVLCGLRGKSQPASLLRSYKAAKEI